MDWFATRAALERGMSVIVIPAQFEAYGPAAGPIRNALMVKYCTRGKGFRKRLSGWSPGSDDMSRKLTAAKKRFDVEVNTWAA